MSIAFTEINKIAWSDFYYMGTSGEGDKFYATKSNNTEFLDNLGYKSSNASKMQPVAKWIERLMHKMDQIVVEHKWNEEFVNDPRIGESGFNWYMYLGSYTLPFTPNSGQPYSLGGYNCNNIDFWKQVNDNLVFFYDNLKDEYDLDAFSDILPDSDTIENYVTNSGYISRWKQVFNNFTIYRFNDTHLNMMFDPYGSGYTLFSEEYPSQIYNDAQLNSIELAKYAYRIPYSGLGTQYKLTKNQGYTRPFSLYGRYVLFNSGSSLKFLNNHGFMTKSVTVTSGNSLRYSDPDIDQELKVQQLNDQFNVNKWIATTNDNPFVGNKHSIDYDIIHSFDHLKYNSPYRLATYIPASDRLSTAGYIPYNAQFIIPSGITANWSATKTSNFVYSIAPVSARAFTKITTGASGINHKLNDRWTNNIANSVRARYGLCSGDFSKIFFPGLNSDYNTWDTLYTNETVYYGGGFGSIFFGGGAAQIGPALSSQIGVHITTSLPFNHIHYNSGFISFINPSDGLQTVYTNNNNFLSNYENFLTVGSGLELVYGYLDIINEVHQPNINILRSIGRDAIDYTSTFYDEFSGERESQPSDINGNSLLNIIQVSGVYLSDIIADKLINETYTTLMTRQTPPINHVFSGIFVAEEDYTNNSVFPDNMLVDIPPPSSTHIWFAIKSINFDIDFQISPVNVETIDDIYWNLPLSGNYYITNFHQYSGNHPGGLTSVPIVLPTKFYLGTYKPYYIDGFNPLDDSYGIGVPDQAYAIRLPQSGVYSDDYTKQIFAMKNYDNNNSETLINFIDNYIYVTSRIGHLTNDDTPAVQLPNGSISGNLLAMILPDSPPLKPFPNSVTI